MTECVTTTLAVANVNVRIGDSTPVTVLEIFERAAREHASRIAFCVHGVQGKSWTWREYYDDVQRAAKGLIALGHEAGKGVAIIGYNSPEWAIAYLGAMFAGGVAVPIYCSDSPKALWFAARHCEADVVIVDNAKTAKMVLRVIDRLPNVKAIVQWSGQKEANAEGRRTCSWTEFLAAGADVRELDIRIRCGNVMPGSCSCIVYNAGASGNPLGVMLSHDNFTWAAKQLGQKAVRLTKADKIFSYLPLCHTAAQMMDIHLPMATGAHVTFAPHPGVLRAGLETMLKDISPTIFMAVPRTWEKLLAIVNHHESGLGFFGRALSKWARNKQLKNSLLLQAGEPGSGFGSWLADKLVTAKLRESLGLSNCKLWLSVGAPMNEETLHGFLGLNMIVDEGITCTECTTPITCTIGQRAAGTVGRPLQGTDFRLMNKDRSGNGQVRTRGRHVFIGYLANPEETAQAFDEDGFLISGDIGKLDNVGALVLTGRVKDIIQSSNGVSVAAVPLEEALRKSSPIFGNAMIVGEGKPYLCALLTLKTNVNSKGAPIETLAPEVLEVFKENRISCTGVVQAVASPQVKELVDALIKKALERNVSRAHQIKKWILLPRDFSVANGELGPSGKLRRSAIAEQYALQINELYR